MITDITPEKECRHIYGYDTAWECFVTDKQYIDKYTDPLFTYCPLCSKRLVDKETNNESN